MRRTRNWKSGLLVFAKHEAGLEALCVHNPETQMVVKGSDCLGLSRRGAGVRNQEMSRKERGEGGRPLWHRPFMGLTASGSAQLGHACQGHMKTGAEAQPDALQKERLCDPKGWRMATRGRPEGRLRATGREEAGSSGHSLAQPCAPLHLQADLWPLSQASWPSWQCPRCPCTRSTGAWGLCRHLATPRYWRLHIRMKIRGQAVVPAVPNDLGKVKSSLALSFPKCKMGPMFRTETEIDVNELCKQQLSLCEGIS